MIISVLRYRIAFISEFDFQTEAPKKAEDIRPGAAFDPKVRFKLTILTNHIVIMSKIWLFDLLDK